MALRNGNAGNFEIIDTVPGGQGDVNEEDLKKVDTPSLAREIPIVRHLNWVPVGQRKVSISAV